MGERGEHRVDALDLEPRLEGEVDPAPPATKSVLGSNVAALNVTGQDGVAVVTCAIDNLVKGAGGQGIQALNLRFGLEETAGLPLNAAWP